MNYFRNAVCIGQTVSIIGGLVAGSAAVEASLISPAALIAVAAAGICGFALPGRDLGEALRLWRFGLTMAGSLGGLFGLTIDFLALIVHLSGIESLGVPYFQPLRETGHPGFIRSRLKKHKIRDGGLNPPDRKNQR